MSNALAMLDRVGATLNDLDPQAETEADEDAPREVMFTEVEEGPELLRILSLPRRSSPRVDSPSSIEMARFLTDRLAKVPKPYPGSLRPLQGPSLAEGWQCRGLAGFIRVGGGKMLLSYLMGAVLQVQTVVALIAPAQMRSETLAQFKRYQDDWHGPGLAGIKFISYEELQAPAAGQDLDHNGAVIRAGLLEQLRPKLVVLDEAHLAQSTDNVARRRLEAYKRENPDVVVVVLTGTPFNNSIRDGAVLLEWALGDQSPLPRTDSKHFKEMQMWSSYLDPNGGKNGPRTGVGALVKFLDKSEWLRFHSEDDPKVKRKIIRRAIARWMYDTPGVISSQEGKLIDDDGREIGLSIQALEPARESEEVEEFFKVLRGDKLEALREGRPREQLTDTDPDTGRPLLAYPGWRLPDGTEGEDGLWFARHADTGGMGFWQKMDPAPPDEYVVARNQWSKWCRKMISKNRRGIDSAARMVQAVRKGLYDDEGLLAQWEAASAEYTAETGLKAPPTVPIWLSDEAVRAAEAWMRQHNGLIWVRYTGLGERLAKDLGVPYYARGSKDAKTKVHIMQHRGGGGVVQVASAKVGKNLQGFWSANLWMCPPAEQTMARTHRAGQKADVVRNWVYVGCYEHLKSFYAGRDEKADFHGDMTLQDQKLNYADGSVPPLADLEARGTNRWCKEDWG